MSAMLAAARALAAPRGVVRLVPPRVRGAFLRGVVGALLRSRRLDELLDGLAADAPPSPGAGRGDGEGSGARPPAPHETVAGLRRLPATCLHRALAGYAALRRAREDVRFVIGVRREDDEVLAHAWIEQAGAPVGEPADPRARFTVAWVHPPVAEAAPARQEREMAASRPSPDIVLTRLADGTGVLLHLATKFYYTLNRTGVVAWEVISRTRRVDRDAIVAALVERFAGVDRAAAEADVDALLAELEAEGLLAGEP